MCASHAPGALLHASQPQSSNLGRCARPGHPISGHLGRRSDARARGLALISVEKSNNGFSLSDAGEPRINQVLLTITNEPVPNLFQGAAAKGQPEPYVAGKEPACAY